MQLTGADLTIAGVVAVARGSGGAVSISAEATERMRRSRAVIERLAAGDAPIYAVNTGVGLLADVRIPRDDLEQLQRNVMRSHAAGVGEPLAREVVRAMMLIRANVLAKGFSGIRPLVAERLCDLLEPRRHAGGALAGQRGRVRRPGAAGPHGAGADRRRRSRVRRRASCPAARRCARAGIEPLDARSQGRHQPDQRHAGHAGHRLPGTGRRGDAGRNRRRGLRPDARRAARHAARFRRAHPRARARIPARWKAPRACASCWKAARSASRTSPAAACRTPIRCAARRRCTAPCATRWPKRAASSPSS